MAFNLNKQLALLEARQKEMNAAYLAHDSARMKSLLNDMELDLMQLNMDMGDIVEPGSGALREDVAEYIMTAAQLKDISSLWFRTMQSRTPAQIDRIRQLGIRAGRRARGWTRLE